MSRKIRLKRGALKDLPQLELGEPGVATDEGTMFIGTDRGNIRLANQEDLDGVSQQLADTESYVKRKEKDIFDYVHLVPNNVMMPNPDDWDWTAAIQTAINEITSSNEYNQLNFPAGKYKVSDVVGYLTDVDIDIGLHIKGSGRTASTGKATTIEQTDPTKDCLSFRSSKSNIRGLVIKDIQIFGGVNGLYLENCVYNYFSNVSFSRQTSYSIRGNICAHNIFESCFAVHVSGNFCHFSGNGTNHFIGGKIGEDAGGVSVTTGTLKFYACSFHDMRNKKEPLGLFELGNNVFGIDSGGQIFLESCDISTNRSACQVLVTTNNQRSCRISNCNIILQNQKLLVSRYQTLAYKNSPFNILGNNIEWDGNTVMFDNGVSGTTHSPLRNSIFDGNTITIPTGVTIQSEDWFVTPSLNNRLGLNTIKEV